MSTKKLSVTAADPSKRIHYVNGLVLGADEFNQEQTYLMARDTAHQRGLHGYGTVSGLKVSVEGEGNDAKVVVGPGLAIDQCGRSIHVCKDQCATLKDWADQIEVSPDPGVAYLYLCYRECETDYTPVPSGPCKSAEESMEASRIADSFELKFSLDPPTQTEEDVTRLFGRFLERIEITDSVASGTGFDPGEVWSEFDPENPFDLGDEDLTLSSPDEPSGLRRIRIHPDSYESTMAAISCWWVTVARPTLVGKLCEPCEDGCVFLAEIRYEISAGAIQSIQVIEKGRPSLFTTRALQEWARIGTFAFESDETLAGEMAGGDLTGLYPNPEVAGLRGNPIADVAPAQSGQLLQWDGARWRPWFAIHGDPDDVQPGQLLGWDDANRRWVAVDLPDHGGDVVGPQNSTEVRGLRGRPINSANPVTNRPPQNGQIYQFIGADDSGQWIPVPVDAVNLENPEEIAPSEGAIILRWDPDLPPTGQWRLGRLPNFPELPDLSEFIRRDDSPDETGDLSETYGAPRVNGIGGRGLAEPFSPAEGDALRFQDGRWTPTAAPSGGGSSDYFVVGAGSFAALPDGFDIGNPMGNSLPDGVPPIHVEYRNAKVSLIAVTRVALRYAINFRDYVELRESHDFILKGTAFTGRNVDSGMVGGSFQATVQLFADSGGIVMDERGIQFELVLSEFKQINVLRRLRNAFPEFDLGQLEEGNREVWEFLPRMGFQLEVSAYRRVE